MKNKMNNKGFTLIELLAVVVILLAISVIAISSISAAIERNKDKQNQAKIKIIESYAELYYDEHKNTVTGNKITLNQLLEGGYATADELTDANGNNFSGCVTFGNGGKGFTYTETGC